jgi:hypothetical protein
MKTLNAFKAELLADPTTRAAYEALAPEFETARELVAARARAGLTQQQVAECMGTTQSTVARMESGKRPRPCAPCSVTPRPLERVPWCGSNEGCQTSDQEKTPSATSTWG